MAGIAVALSVIPTVIPLVVRLLDRVFPPKSGGAKADAATEIVAAIQQGLVNSKAAAGTPLTGDQIRAAIEGVVGSLNAAGELKGAATAIESVSPAIGALADLLLHLGAAMKGVR